MSFTSLFLLCLGLSIASATSRDAGAQSTPRVQIALVDSLSAPEARAELVRFSTPERPDLILLRVGSASRDDLIAALVLQSRITRPRPDKPGVVSRLTIVTEADPRQVPAEILRRADQMLRTVRNAPLARIGNLGRGRWGEFDALK